MFPELTPTHWLTLHGLATSLAVLVYVASSHVMHQRRQPTAAVAWMLFILLLPYLALPAYLLFGTRKLTRPHSRISASRPATHGKGSWAVETILSLGQPAPAPYSDLRVHENGHQAVEALLRTIDAAPATIDLCTFILGRDSLGQAVVDWLCSKALAGVRDRLLLDGMGSLMERHPDLAGHVQSGGEFVLFVPPLRSPLKGRTNLRDHRKAAGRRCRSALGSPMVWWQEPGRRVLRGLARPSTVARPELRPGRTAGAPGQRTVRAGLGICQRRAHGWS